MKRYTALIDANIFYPAPLRDVFLQFAVAGLFQLKWSADIHREWMEALLENEPWRSRSALERTRQMMDQATRDSLVTGYDSLIPALSLPDPKDRHVLAAAIVGRCNVIVTKNLRHFPENAVAPFHIEAQHPDPFLHKHLVIAPSLFCGAVQKVRARLLNPPYSVDDYLAILSRQGLVITAGALRAFKEGI